MDWLKIVVASLMRQIEKLNKRKADRSDVERLEQELPEGIPEGYTAHQQLVTDADGVVHWEPKLGYIDEKKEVLVPEFTGYMGAYNEFSEIPGTELLGDITEDEVVRVTFDGIEYDCPCQVYWSGPSWKCNCFGNMSLMTGYNSDNTGEPFLIHGNDTWDEPSDPPTKVATITAGEHTIEIVRVLSEKIETIPLKLIDSKIARTEDVTTMINDSVVGKYVTVDDALVPDLTIDNSLSMGRSPDGEIGGRSTVLGDNCVASGYGSFAAGYETNAIGKYSVALGSLSKAEGDRSFAFNGTASANSSYAFNATASGEYSLAMGGGTASGTRSFASGDATTASGNGSHTEGYKTEASGIYSHAEGYRSVASGYGAHAAGKYTVASRSSQHVIGAYNIVEEPKAGYYDNGKYISIVGNGTSDEARSNAHTVDWNGLGWFAGGLKVGGTGQDDEAAREIAPPMIVTIRNPGADNASCDKTSVEIAEAANKGIPVIGHIIESDDSGVEQMRIANFTGLWDNGTPETVGAFFYDVRLANGFKNWGDNLSFRVLEITPDAAVTYCGGSAFAAMNS